MGQIRLNFGGVTALLVDRSNYCRSLIAQMLRGFGLQAILSCENGAEAQELLNRRLRRNEMPRAIHIAQANEMDAQRYK